MPPHCDALDGPVVKAARQALEAADVKMVLPFVHDDGEDEVIGAFEQVMEVRRHGGTAAELADRSFFETVVRVHRAGEGAPYTGLKPAGLDVGPAIPAAERAIETGSLDELLDLMSEALRGELHRRFDLAMTMKEGARGGVTEARQYVEAMLGLEVYANKLYQCIRNEPHEARPSHGG